MASRQSSPVPNGTVLTTCSVAGFSTSHVAPFDASRHCPPINCWYE
jgi:hypothetical protein